MSKATDGRGFRSAVLETLLAVALAAGWCSASVPIMSAHGVERLPNGNTLITDGGGIVLPTGRVLEVDSVGRLVWAYMRSDIPWAHTARRLPSGNTLISASNGDRVIEVNPNGYVAWELASGLSYPNEAYRLPDGNTLITDRNHDRVIEVDSAGAVVWSYANLRGPHNGSRLPNGNTLICDSDRGNVVEVNPQGTVTWQYSNGLDWARSAQRLAGGNTLIADSRHNRIVEVDSAGTTRWSYAGGLSMPYMAVRLENGNTLLSHAAEVREVTPSGSIAWQYPPAAAASLVESLWVVNPTSGCSLYVHIHRPAGSGPTSRIPGVVVVPDLNEPGTVLDEDGLADSYATDGFAVLHFDADGRGRSSGLEDYCGFIQQDGLHACAVTLAGRPYVDAERLGIYARGYGITMASGMLARHMLPAVKFLLDFEGPADRSQTCEASGGHVPVPPDSEAFWQEREAARFIRNTTAAYLRIQTEMDHNPSIGDNRHCIALIDSATSSSHGGSGMCAWTRVNDSAMNPANQTYSLSSPPAWIGEPEERHLICRELLYLHELADMDLHPGIESRDRKPGLRNPGTGCLSITPNPVTSGFVTFRLRADGTESSKVRVRIVDAAGRLVQQSLTLDLRTPTVVDVRSLRSGVYFVRLAGTSGSIGARMVVAR